ncbi:MAG: sigma-70 family RNA polymerase sigma factor [Armatimonadetes bacterium]|nr:sigma-70 family RNA polymerase sigma factor [Armatimonadota bacterium]
MLFRKPQTTADVLRARYLSAVLSYVATRVGADAAEDITAEVFGAAFRALSRCPAPAPQGSEHDPARAWLFGIARHKVADHLRRPKNRETLPLPESLLAPGGPEASVERAETARALRCVLEALPELQKEALLLKYVEQLSLAEIALALGKSETAISQLLYRARQSAREHGKAYFCSEEL